jgi:nitrogen-specific signal transduction histidine kinase
MFLLYKDYNKSIGDKRIRTGYLLSALLIAILSGSPNYALWYNIPLPPILNPFFSLYVVMIAYAITKHHLMDISIIISRTVAELLTVTFLGSIYVCLVWFYRAYISINIDIPFLVWTILYGVLVGQTHDRIRLFIQTTADKVFLKGEYDYYKELSEISSQITRSLSVENILQTLHKAFYEVLEVSNPKIYLQDELLKPEVKEYLNIKEPTFIAEELILPCLIEGKPIAIIKLGRKLSEDPYTDEDIRLLKALANQTAVALDHHRMYEEMLRAQKQLLQGDKLASMGRVAAGLAHEIKNPLAAIKGMAQTMEQNIDDPEYIADFKEVVPKEIDRLNNLVQNLLKLGRTPKLAFTQVNVNQLIENTLKLFENRCRQNNVKIFKTLNPVPVIKADPEKLIQVFTNLILNAIQAMPGGGSLTVESRSTSHDSLVIEITDTGKGIPEDKLKDIFEPFFSTKEEGLGLGLAITYKIIKDHNGDILVESELGKKTKFSLILPI